MPYIDKDTAKEAARLRKQKQRSHPMSHPENVTPDMSHPNPGIFSDKTAQLGERSPSEQEVFINTGADIRTPAYLKCKAEQHR